MKLSPDMTVMEDMIPVLKVTPKVPGFPYES